MLDALLGEHRPASGLRAQPVQRGVAAVDRKLKLLGESRLVVRHAERDDHPDLGPTDEPPDPFDCTGPREKLPGQRLVPSVDERDRFESAPRLRRVELWNEREVVVDDARVNRLRCHVDHARPRCSQQAQYQAEKALLVGGEDRNQLVGHVEADRVDDDDGPFDVADRAQRDGRPDGAELRLELGERLLCHGWWTLLRAAHRC